MMKSMRANSVSANQSTKQFYPFGSENAQGVKSKASSVLAGDVKEWEEARCPICLEHPHNAVLLQCSSYDKGCRPYICNTSYRHSNCLDQFIKSYASCPSTARIEDVSSRVPASPDSMGELPLSLELGPSTSELPWLGQMEPSTSEPEQMEPSTNELQTNHACPLCRGQIYGWFVVRDARKFMNSKTRACSNETCNFSGNYSELRKHARSDHPFVRPSDVDPQRQQNWTAMVREREILDLFGLMYPLNDEGDQEPDFFNLLTLLWAANEAQQSVRQEELGEEEEEEEEEEDDDDDDDEEEPVDFHDESVNTAVQLTDITFHFELFNRQNYFSGENLNFSVNVFPGMPGNWVSPGQNNGNFGCYGNYEPQMSSPSGITNYGVANTMPQSNNFRRDRRIEWTPWAGQSRRWLATNNYRPHRMSHDQPRQRRPTFHNYRLERSANHPSRGRLPSNSHYHDNQQSQGWSTNNNRQSDGRFLNRQSRRWWTSDNYR